MALANLTIAPGSPSVASTAIDSDTDPEAPEEVQDLQGQSHHEVSINVGSESEVEMAEPKPPAPAALRSASSQRQTSLLHWTATSQPSAKKLKLLTAREATWRRRERASALRFWEVQLPPPVVGYDLQVERLCLSTSVNGLEIHFPVEPFPRNSVLWQRQLQPWKNPPRP